MEVKEWLGEDNQLGFDIWNSKYRYNNESLDEWFDRVSGGDQDLAQLIKEKKFLFAGRTLTNRGTGRGGSFSNCYAYGRVGDSLEEILQCAKDIGMTYKSQGGQGVSLSNIRPKGADIKNGAYKSDGIIPFMEIFNTVTSSVSQGGSRKGALMMSLDINHPEIKDFITIKTDLNRITKANLSVEIDNKFMQKVLDGNQEAIEVFDMLIQTAYDYGEPGVMYMDRFRNYNMMQHINSYHIDTSNPCQPSYSPILTPNGFIQLKDVDSKIVLNGKVLNSSKAFHTGFKSVYSVELSNGITVDMTMNHPILTPNGDVNLENLKEGDKVLVDHTPIFNTGVTNQEEYELGVIAGWFVADGGFDKNKKDHPYLSFCIGRDEFEYKDIIEELIQKHLDKDFKFSLHHQKPETCMIGKMHKKNVIINFTNNILKINNFNKFDTTLMYRSKDFKLGFLRAIFTCDGSSRSSAPVNLYSINKLFLQDIQRCLIEFGVYSNLCTHNKERSYIAKDNKIRNNKETYKLEIYDIEFIKIGYLTDYKNISMQSRLIKSSHRVEQKKKELSIKSITYIGEMDVYDITVEDVHHYNSNGLIVHNCGEQPLPKHGACCLASINLSEHVVNPYTQNAKFDYDLFKKSVSIGVKALDQIVTEGVELHALQEQRDFAKNFRNIGLGIMGLADMMVMIGVKYGSPESIKIVKDIMHTMFKTAVITSNELAKELGSFPKFDLKMIESDIFKNHNFTYDEIENIKLYGLRNSTLLSIAPTGSIGTMLDISGGIEPFFALQYQRKTESLGGKGDQYYTVDTKAVKEFKKTTGKSELPDYFITTSNLDWKSRVDLQAAAQNSIDTAISSTVNLPYETKLEDVKDLYKYAWGQGVKGITIFRDGCKRFGILTVNPKEDDDAKTEDNTYLEWGAVIEISDDLIGKKRKIVSGCGNIHVQAWFDPFDGRMLEVFFSKGSTGGCNSFMTGTSRMVSLALRAGVSLDIIVEQLRSSPSCPSYVVRRAVKKDTSKGDNCTSAIGNALLDMQKEINEDLFDEHDDDFITKENEEILEKFYKSLKANMIPCPSCNEGLIMTEGCVKCSFCGYTKCN